MLPSRLIGNARLSSPLRALLIQNHPLPQLPHKVQLRLRPSIALPSLAAPQPSSRFHYSTTTSSGSSANAINKADEGDSSAEKPPERQYTDSNQPVAQIQPKLSLTFTCTFEGCGKRSTHEFTKHAYEKGIVIVQCPGCKKRHLVADHLGWFKELTEDGKLRTVEDFVRAEKEASKQGKLPDNGTIEVI